MRLAFLTLFYSGLSPKAPGTVGSFLAFILGMLALNIINTTTIFLVVVLVTIVSIKQIDIYEKQTNQHDNKEIVIDEFVGMWLTLSIAGVQSGFWIAGFIGFVYFRIFDILKPSIIGKIDKNIKGGWGVMGDDLLAGIFAGICTSITCNLLC
jgi:phosphatidylglycerophosphatase A